ncbi:hypothetical protein [Streptomyces sp. NPDC048172]|uniref:hypothetical protein n=1 Tax=Streptomyces sp. NPDC048172 TaxID=3365505 RepID=UPI003719C00A
MNAQSIALTTVAVTAALSLTTAAPATATTATTPSAHPNCYINAPGSLWIHACIQNNTDKPLTKINEGLDHGTWHTKAPREIQPKAEGRFASTSNGVMTGTKGWVTYNVDGQDYTFWWSNPFIGSSSEGVDCHGECRTRVHKDRDEQTRGNTELRWTIG